MRYATDHTTAAQYDFETGLYARWYLEVRTDDDLAQALRTSKRAVVIRVKAPEAYLNERLAGWLRTGLRARDLAGVLGPSTFAIVLNDIDEEGVERILERARVAVGWPLSTSISWFPDDGLTFDALIRHAGATRARAQAA